MIQSALHRVQAVVKSARQRMAAPAERSGELRVAHLGMVPSDSDFCRMPTADEQNAWIRAVATSADRQAFAALFRYFAPRIKGFLVRSGCTDALAEELAQETMVVLWRRASTFDPGKAQLSTWLYTIARNVRISHLRRQGAAPAGAEAADDWDADLLPADLELGPDEQLLAAQREHGVRRALAGLPPEQALVLRLSYFDEQPHARIAADLGIPLGTVKSRIRLAVTQLRRLLAAFES